MTKKEEQRERLMKVEQRRKDKGEGTKRKGVEGGAKKKEQREG